MSDKPVTYDRAVHSDFLIHWTGKDLEADEPSSEHWYEKGLSSKTEEVPGLDEKYIERLQNVLRYGLWMTEEGDQEKIVGSAKIVIPSTPICCFTELKISEGRRHAARYGRLGIGVKRPFLIDRFGRPMVYFGFTEGSNRDKFLVACCQDLKDKSLLNFFKPMNAKNRRQRELEYELYSESEWRILYFKELLESRLIVDPRDSNNVAHHSYFQSLDPKQQEKLRYLIPLDGWFSMIIYPSMSVKNKVQWGVDNEVRALIEGIKMVQDHGNSVESRGTPRRGNWPIEVCLDSIRHF